MFRKIILAFMLMLALSAPAFATVSSTNSRMDYTGNGTVSTYSYTYRIFSNTDLLVTVRDTSDVETALTLTTDYTVTGVGGGSGGTIVLVNASQTWLTAGKLKSGYVLTIRRVRPLKQLTDIRNQGAFYPEVHEDAFDSLVMIAQQHQDEIDRSMKLPETIDPADFDTELPADLAANPGSSIIVNDTGDGFAAGPTADAISGAQANATAAAASAAAAALSATDAINAGASAVYIWGGTVGGTADAITLTPSPALGSYTAGKRIAFLSTGTNTTAVTVNVSGLGVKSIKTQSGAALTAGEITSGRIYSMTYDGTNFNVHELANVEDGVITNAKVNSSAAIAYSKLNIGAGAIADSKLAQITTASKVSAAAITSASSLPAGAGVFPIANLATGTPDGTKFIRDDGTLASASIGTGYGTITNGSTISLPSGYSSGECAWMVGGGHFDFGEDQHATAFGFTWSVDGSRGVAVNYNGNAGGGSYQYQSCGSSCYTNYIIVCHH